MLDAMNEPQFGGGDDYGNQPLQPPSYPPPPYPPYGNHGSASVPYGRHPVTGEPLSDKSKLIAGILQLLGLIGLLGVGRVYMGQTSFGVVQLVCGILITAITCGFGFFVPAIWGVVDCVILLSGTPRDSFGRPLRSGG